jgi:hypothetical protein
MPPTPKRRWFRFSLRRLFVVVTIAALCLWWVSPHGWTVTKLEQLIHAEMSPGCDRTAAEAWFSRHGIQCTWFDDVTAIRWNGQTIPEVSGFQNEDLSGMLLGEIGVQEANVGLISTGDIEIYFFFDKRGRLLGHLVHPHAYARW